MCGLVAVISKRPNFGFSRDELNVFKTMLFLDTLRGEDSTGVFGIDKLGNVSIAKEASEAYSFMSSKEFSDIDSKMFKGGFALVGHNRKATRGSITDQNAHPFWVRDEVVLVHNGTFYGDHKHIADVEVDSHALAHAIADHKPDDTDEVFKKINAAYATIWYDVRSKKLNFLRNSQRPLWFAQTANAWFVCSEREMIEFALKREKVTAPTDGFKYSILKENVVCSIRNENGNVTTDNHEISGYKHTHYTQVQSGWNAVNEVLEEAAAQYNKADACAWDNHVDKLTEPLKLPAPGVAGESASKRTDSISEIQKCIVDDMPAGMYQHISYTKYTHIREVYSNATGCYFIPSNIAQFDKGRYIIYGRLTTQENVIGFSLIEESDFAKLVDANKQVELFGKVRYTSYVNVVENGERPDDWSGYALVRVENPTRVLVEENAHCSC